MPPSPNGGDPRWSFAVLGPGGVGGLLAGMLARDGSRVVCVAREAAAARLRTHGLRVRSVALGDVTLSEAGGTAGIPFRVATRLDGPVDACLVTVKATQLGAACERVPAERLGDGLVVPLLNGFEHMDELRRRYRPEQVVAATIGVEAYQTEPGAVVHGSPFVSVALARGAAGARADALAERLRRAGVMVTVGGDETAVLWDKLSYLGPAALLTTHAAAPIGVVRADRRADLHALIREAAAVATALGADTDPEAVIARVDGFPSWMRGSMQRDIDAGRPTELDEIGGAILRAAARVGVDVPVTARIVADLRAAERTRAPAAP